jgi:4-hydroxybenzoate polyprenyltransferase
MAYSYEENPVIFHQYGNEFCESIARRLHNLIDFIMFSSTYVAIAAAGMVYTSCFIQGIDYRAAIIGIMTLVAFSIYNLNRKTDEEEDEINHKERFVFTKTFEKPLFYAAIFAYTIALGISVLYGIQTFLVAIIPLISGILYSIPIMPASWHYHRLKEIPVIKNLVVAVAWALPLSLLPVYITSTSPDWSTAITALFFFNYVFIASILPDIRDREGDALTHVMTIPVTIGVKRTLALLTVINLIIGGLVLSMGIRFLSGPVFTLLLIGICYSQFCIWSVNGIISIDHICDVLSDGQFILFGGAIATLTTLKVII